MTSIVQKIEEATEAFIHKIQTFLIKHNLLTHEATGTWTAQTQDGYSQYALSQNHPPALAYSQPQNVEQLPQALQDHVNGASESAATDDTATSEAAQAQADQAASEAKAAADKAQADQVAADAAKAAADAAQADRAAKEAAETAAATAAKAAADAQASADAAKTKPVDGKASDAA